MVKKTKSLYRRHRFPVEVIGCAVLWYFRFQLSLLDIKELLFGRGVTVIYETIRCWYDSLARAAARRKRDGIWHLDEMFIMLCGEPYLLWRVVDKHRTELDILAQRQHDKATAKRLFKRVLRLSPVPRRLVTDQLRSYLAANAEMPELVNVRHLFVKCIRWYSTGQSMTAETPSIPDRKSALPARVESRACAFGAPLHGFGLDLFLVPERQPSNREWRQKRTLSVESGTAVSTSRLRLVSTILQRTVISPRGSARRPSCRVSIRSGNTSD